MYSDFHLLPTRLDPLLGALRNLIEILYHEDNKHRFPTYYRRKGSDKGWTTPLTGRRGRTVKTVQALMDFSAVLDSYFSASQTAIDIIISLGKKPYP